MSMAGIAAISFAFAPTTIKTPVGMKTMSLGTSSAVYQNYYGNTTAINNFTWKHSLLLCVSSLHGSTLLRASLVIILCVFVSSWHFISPLLKFHHIQKRASMIIVQMLVCISKRY